MASKPLRRRHTRIGIFRTLLLVVLVVCSSAVSGATITAETTQSADTSPTDGPADDFATDTRPALSGDQFAGDWPTAGHDFDRSGHNRNSSGPKTGPDARWIHEFPDDSASIPVLTADNLVYIPGETSIRAVDNETGETVWNRSDLSFDEFTVADGVLVTNDNGYKGDLRAYDATTGADLWNQSEVTRTGLAVRDGVLYSTGSSFSSTSLYATDLSTGADLWNAKFSADSVVGLSVSGDTIYVTGKEWTRDYAVYALNASDGSEQWRFEMEGPVSMHAVIVDGSVYVGAGSQPRDQTSGTYDPKFYRLNATDGHVEWIFDVNTRPHGAAVANDTVYLAAGNSVHALDVATGERQWIHRLPGSVDYGLTYTRIDALPPAVADGSVYAANDRGYLVALDGTTGTEQWTYRLEGESTRPIVADDRVYIHAKDKTNSDYTRVYALEEPPFEFTGFTPSTTTVTPGEQFTVDVTVENVDSETRAYNLSLMADPPLPVDWWTLDRANGTLDPGDSTTLTFTGQLNTSGTWNVSVKRLLADDAAVGATITVAHGERNDDWAFIGFDANRTKSNPNTYGPKQHLQEVWNLSNFDGWLQPVIANGSVFVAHDRNNAGESADLVRAYRETDGAQEWSFNVSAYNRRIAGSPTYDTDTVFLYTTPFNYDGTGVDVTDASVFALNASDGTVRWVRDTSLNYSSISGDQAPVVDDGVVYVSGGKVDGSDDVNASVLALDAVDGSTRWRYDVNDDRTTESAYPVAVENGTTVAMLHEQDDDFSGYTERLVALDSGGTVVWSTTDYVLDLTEPPVIRDGAVYVVNETTNGAGERAETLFALNLSDGGQRWEFVPDDQSDQVDDWRIYEPTVTADAVFVRQMMLEASSPRPNELYKLDPSSGTLIWNRSTPALLTRFHVDGLIYGGGAGGDYTYVYDPESGEYYSSNDLLSRESGTVQALANGTMITYADSTRPNDFRVLREGGIFEYTDIRANTTVAGVGEYVNVSVNVTNTGSYARTFDVNIDAAPDDITYLYVMDGKSRTGRLQPGETTTLSWTVLLKERSDMVFFIVPGDDQYMVRHMYDRAGSVTVNVGDDRDGTVIDLGGPRSLSPGPDSWPTADFDAGNTGNNSGTAAPTAVGSGSVNWSVNHSREWTSGPTMAANTVFVGGEDDSGLESVFAYNATHGSLRWQYVSTSTSDVEVAPIYADGYVYTAASDGRVYQLNASTGERLWTFSAGDDGGITVVDNIAYVSGTSGTDDVLFALNATTREIHWTFAKPSSGYGMSVTPAVDDGTVYVVQDGQATYALNASTGVEQWSRSIAGASSRLHSPTVANGLVYVDDTTYSSTNANLYALDATDGSTEWSTAANVDGYTGSSPALANDTLYFTADGSVRAVNATTGTEQWRTTVCTAARHSPAYADGIVYVPMTDSTIRAYDADSGDLVWRYDAYYEAAFTPAVVNGVLYTTGLEEPDDVYALMALEGGQTNQTKPLFSFSGLSVSSANVSTGESFTVSATVSNNGDAACEYSANFSVDESVVDTTTGTVGTGYYGSDTASFTHSFASTGTYNVTIEDLAPVQVTVSAPEPDIDVSPTTRDFGEVDPGNSSDGWVKVDNVGDDTLHVFSHSITGTNADEFTVYDDQAVIYAGNSAYFWIRFEPDAAGARTATLTIDTNDPDEPSVSVSLTGTGSAGTPDVNVTPSFVDFGDVPVNATVTKSVTVTNDGDATLTVSGASASPGEYSVTAGGSGTTIAPAASTTVDVTFAPTSMGAAPGTLSVTSDDPDTPTAIVELTGNATAEPAPAIAVDRTSYYFEAIPVDGTSEATFELSNTGTAPLEVSGTALSGADAGAFTVTTATPVVVQPGSNTTLTVEFAPTNLGSHGATLNVSHNDTAASPTSIELGGTSIDTTPPSVSITDANGTAVAGTTVYANDTVVVNGTATDQHGSVESVTVALVSTFTTFVHTTNASYDAGTGNWSATVDLAQVVDDGDYHVVVAAEDDSGNTNTATATEVVDVDRRPPKIATVMNRVDDSTARVNVTTDDRIEDGSLSVTVDRPDDSTVPVTLTESNGKWTGTFALTDNGQYNATATARDTAGNEGMANATIVFENRSTDANNTITVKVVPSNLFVRFTTNQPVEDTFITMTSSRTPLAPLVRGNAGVNFIDAVLGKELTANLSYATIGIPVDESLLPPNTSPDDVTIRYFNETSKQWEDVSTTREDVTLEDGTSGEYWVANVSHFSTYGAVVADTTAPTITATSPTTGHEYAAGTTKTTLDVDYADSLSGVNASAVTLTFDGSDVTSDSATSITSKRATYRSTGLTNGSSHTLVVSIEDHSGNTATETITFDVASPASSTPSNPGSGGSGGSGSGTPPTTTTPPANTDDDPVETPNPVVDIQTLADGVFDATVSNARANVRNTFTFPAGDLAADGVTLDALDFTATADGDYAFQVSTSTDLPRGTAALDGETATALAYVNVSHPGVSNSLIANATFHFTVSRERLDTAGVAANDLVVYRFTDGSWTPLQTTVVETTDAVVVLEAASPGLSVFAVGAQQAQVTTTDQPPQTTAPATTAAPAGTTAPTTSHEAADGGDVDDAADAGTSTAGIVLLGLLALLAALAVVLYRRRT